MVESVSNDVVKVVSETCRHLEALSIQGCHRVDDTGTSMLYSKHSVCRLSLRSLNITICDEISLQEKLNLMRELKLLTELQCSDFPEVLHRAHVTGRFRYVIPPCFIWLALSTQWES